MAFSIVKNITTGDSGSGTTVLIKKGSISGGVVSMMNITNNSVNPATGVTVDYHDGTTAYPLIARVTIPAGASIVINDISFDQLKYSLRVSNAGTAPSITVILR